MGFDKVLNYITNFIHANQAGAIAAGVILLFLLVKKPKLFFILLLIVIAAIGFMQIYGKVASTGITDRDYRSLGELK